MSVVYREELYTVVILPEVEIEDGTAVSRSQTHIMDANEPLPEDTAATLQFKQDLESLLLEAFATGAAVEGTWELADSSETVPTWTIEITKVAEADTKYDPEVLE